MNYWNNKEKIFNGFSDSELISAVDINVARKLDRQNGSLHIPAMFFASEIYGFGKCYRKQLGWNKYLPLPFYSDHGVAVHSSFTKQEKNNQAKYYLTFDADRYKALKECDTKDVIRVMHPWIKYRHEAGYEISSEAKGTLIFFTHSVPDVYLESFDYSEYFAKLKALPESYHPLVLCLHQYDINKKAYEILRKYGLPIVTMGCPSSKDFVDNFYRTTSNFKYATSCIGGSELFYCQELGVEFFILGNEPRYVNKSNVNLPIGEFINKDLLSLEKSERKRELFLFGTRTTSQEKNEFCSSVLGCDGDENIKNIVDYRKVFNKELIRLTPYYFKRLFNALIQRLK